MPDPTQVLHAHHRPPSNILFSVDSTFSPALPDLFPGNIPLTKEKNPAAPVDTSLAAQVNGSGSTVTTTTTSTAPPTTKPGATPTTVLPGNPTQAQLIAALNDAFDQADADLKKGDLAAYANDIAKAQAIAAQLDKAQSTTTAPP